MHPKMKLRHCARGLIQAASPTNGTVFYLFNNSTGRDFIVVWDFEFATAAVVTWTLNGVFQGHNGTASGTISTVVTGETALPGVMYFDDNATPPPQDFVNGLLTNFTLLWAHDYPFAVLQPGWSFFIGAPQAKATVVFGSFFWQRVGAEDIDRWYEDFA